jgi:hypothetical protein
MFPSAATEYSALTTNAVDRKTYTDMKGPFILSIVEKARKMFSNAFLV